MIRLENTRHQPQ